MVWAERRIAWLFHSERTGPFMTDQTQESTNSNDGGMDRRSLLTKAAAAGAVAWSVPLLLSEPAFAGNGVCTPSCAPGSFAPILKGIDVCKTDFEALPNFVSGGLKAFVGNSVKMAVISIQAPSSVSCPCGGVAVPAFVSGLNSSSHFWKMASDQTSQAALAAVCAPPLANNPDLDVFPLTNYNISSLIPAGVTGFTSNNSFALGKSGSIQNGTFKSDAQICVAVGCPDEVGGDIVYRRCKFTLCFSYTPAGNCGTSSTVYSLFTPVANSCVVGCGLTC